MVATYFLWTHQHSADDVVSKTSAIYFPEHFRVPIFDDLKKNVLPRGGFEHMTTWPVGQ